MNKESISVKILNLLYKHRNKGKLSQELIAERLGIKRRQVTPHTKILMFKSFVKKESSPRRWANYSINEDKLKLILFFWINELWQYKVGLI